jgi:hypothetical protein
MRTTLLAICIAVLCAAATPATPSAPRDHAGVAPFLVATVTCGSGGCVPVRTKQEKHRKFQTLGHG